MSIEDNLNSRGKGNQIIKTGGGVTLEFFPPSYIELQKEVLLHPPVAAKVAEMSASDRSDWTVVVAKLAAEVHIVLDDYYTAEDIDIIASMIVRRLQARRGVVVS